MVGIKLDLEAEVHLTARIRGDFSWACTEKRHSFAASVESTSAVEYRTILLGRV